MKSRDFAYWLQGFFEITRAHGGLNVALVPSQVELIEKHLALVFKHEIDPAMGDAKHQAGLNEIHGNDPGKLVFRC
jgi:hypothetical protein